MPTHQVVNETTGAVIHRGTFAQCMSAADSYMRSRAYGRFTVKPL